MNVKSNNEADLLNDALGGGGEVQLVPILIPVDTFRMLLEAGKKRGLSISDLISKSIELFLQPKQDITTNREETRPVRTPDVVIRRKRNQ